jgi:hypothetical protein
MSKRECGSCSLCCKVLDVPAVYKPAGQWCKHFAAGTGCEIHQLRPKACRTFECMWLSDDWLGEEWKPSTSKFVLTKEYEVDAIAVHVDPKAPNSWKLEPYYSNLKKLAVKLLAENKVLLIYESQRQLLVLPDQEVPCGQRGDLIEWDVTPKDGAPGHFDVVLDFVKDGTKGGPTRFETQVAAAQG